MPLSIILRSTSFHHVVPKRQIEAIAVRCCCCSLGRGLQAGQLNVNIEINLTPMMAGCSEIRLAVCLILSAATRAMVRISFFRSILYQYPYRLLAHADSTDGDGGVLPRKSRALVGNSPWVSTCFAEGHGILQTATTRRITASTFSGLNASMLLIGSL